MALVDRRGVVRLGSLSIISIAALTLCGVIGRASPAGATTTDGDVVLGVDATNNTGCTSGTDPNCEATTTGIANVAGGTAFAGVSTGSGDGVDGTSVKGDGVFGASSKGIGVDAYSESPNKYALFASATSATGGHIETDSKFGAGLEVAIKNTNNLRGAIEAQTSGGGPGIQATSAHGPSVDAVGSHSLALLAQGSSQFTGKTTFARSGKLTVSTGTSTVTKSSISLSSSSLVLATIQGNVAGVYVQGVTVVPGSAGSFTIHLNKLAPSNVTVGWFVVN